MSTTRWAVAAVLTISVALSPVLVFALLPAEPGVRRANFNRIEIGMTQAEVSEIFGTPPSDISPNGKNWIGLQFL
jgi:hypothetical protein